MTNNDIITDSLRLIGVISELESPSAEQGSDGLTVLNDMMASLSMDGVKLGFAPQSDLTADPGLNIEYRKAIKYLLAVDLASHYGAPISQGVAAQAIIGRNQLYREAIRLSLGSSDLTTLPHGETIGGFFSILNG